MITNERQYKITKSQLKKLVEAINSFDIKRESTAVGSEIIAKAEYDAIQSEIENLNILIQEYETLKSGRVKLFRANTLEELPKLLIKARISRNFSQRKLAEKIGIKEQQIQRYEAEQYVTANLARLSQIAKVLGLNISEIAEFKTTNGLIDFNDQGFDWSEFPVKEMYKRNWFQGFFSGPLSDFMKNAEEVVEEFVTNTLPKSICSAARQRIRSGSHVNIYALIAWQCRVIALARKEKLEIRYNRNKLTNEWFRNLVKLSRYDDGPRRAYEYLRKYGIRLIIESHLLHTHLDGAVFLLKDGPVLGMTLRYDRLDNFWFVLLHELIHVKKHLSKGKIESIFDDLDTEAIELEKETDEYASEILVPSKIWEDTLARYIHDKKVINSFAKKIEINPAIVAGKIRKETENYMILTDIIGQGEVRKHFKNVYFSS
jgi:HTH-type transcriptional regulator/antitoxin HigA